MDDSYVVYCQCGCKTELPPFNRKGEPSKFAHGHNRRGVLGAWGTERNQFTKVKPDLPDVPCQCGCGTMLPAINKRGKLSEYVHGHANRGKAPSESTRTKHRETLRRKFAQLDRAPRFWERFADPRYRVFRRTVFERDHYTCQDCGYVAGSEDEIGFAAHHIKPWATYPEGRYDPDNATSLCRPCHMLRHGITPKVNEVVTCACGCGQTFNSVSADGRVRRFINGHNHRGDKRTAEQRKSMSDARKGVPLSEEHRLAIKASHNTPEFKKSVGDRTRGRKLSPEHKTAFIAAGTASNRGRIWTDEMKAKLSNNTERAAKISASLTGKTHSPERKAALTAAQQRRRARERAAMVTE